MRHNFSKALDCQILKEIVKSHPLQKLEFQSWRISILELEPKNQAKPMPGSSLGLDKNVKLQASKSLEKIDQAKPKADWAKHL